MNGLAKTWIGIGTGTVVLGSVMGAAIHYGEVPATEKMRQAFFDHANATGHYIVFEKGEPTHIAVVHNNDNYTHQHERDHRHAQTFLEPIEGDISLEALFGDEAADYSNFSGIYRVNEADGFVDPDGDGWAEGRFRMGDVSFVYRANHQNRRRNIEVNPRTGSEYGLYTDGELSFTID